MKALILAGGEGRRLKPLLGQLPKCLAPLQGRPFIEVQVGNLAKQGIAEFILCVGIGALAIEQALGDGSRLGVTIEYSHEKSPAGTGGAVRDAARHLDGDFLCANGDTLVEFSVKKMEERHTKERAAVTILSKHVEDSAGRGTLVADARDRITTFEEKPPEHGRALINCGYYMMNLDVLAHIPGQKAVSLEKEVFPSLLAARQKMVAFVTGGAFVDIGTPEDYLRVKNGGWKQ